MEDSRVTKIYGTGSEYSIHWQCNPKGTITKIGLGITNKFDMKQAYTKDYGYSS